MTARKDLTWTELQTELTALGYNNAITLSSGKVVIDVGTITGETVDSLTDMGVVEFLYKVRQAAGNAQSTVNATISSASEQLSSFPGFSYSSPTSDGYVGVTQVTTVLIPLNTNNIFGTN
jgi:hypothetical protein